MIPIRLNMFKRFITPILNHQRFLNNSSIFSDETLLHLFSSNQSSLTTIKVVRDVYERLLLEKSHSCERLLLEKSHSCELAEKLYDSVLNENRQIKRELMYFKGILHSRGLMEEFRGYLHGVLQPNTLTPMSTKKMYGKMIDIALNSSTSTPILTPMVYDMFQCFEIIWENLTNVEKTKMSNKLIEELDNLYASLSESVHSMKMARHSRDFVICSDNLTNHQICLIKCIARHFLRLDPSDIRVRNNLGTSNGSTSKMVCPFTVNQSD